MRPEYLQALRNFFRVTTRRANFPENLRQGSDAGSPTNQELMARLGEKLPLFLSALRSLHDTSDPADVMAALDLFNDATGKELGPMDYIRDQYGIHSPDRPAGKLLGELLHMGNPVIHPRSNMHIPEVYSNRSLLTPRRSIQSFLATQGDRVSAIVPQFRVDEAVLNGPFRQLLSEGQGLQDNLHQTRNSPSLHNAMSLHDALVGAGESQSVGDSLGSVRELQRILSHYIDEGARNL
jgi:hypothetical protein